MGGQRHDPAVLPRERPGTHSIGGWVGPRAGLDGCGKSRPQRDLIPDRPARSESLYRLSCPGPHANIHNDIIFRTCTMRSVCITTVKIIRFVTLSAVHAIWLTIKLRHCTKVLWQTADRTENTKSVLLQIRVTTTKHFSTFSGNDSLPRSQFSFNQTNQIQFLFFIGPCIILIAE